MSGSAGLAAHLADTPWWLVFLVVLFTAGALPAASELRVWKREKSGRELENAEQEMRREQNRSLLELRLRAERAIQHLPPGQEQVTAYLELLERFRDAVQRPPGNDDADEGRGASP
ncbi:hypothetical protein [Streptomyces erythrochromogenes]|uniref:hypothetical protein n=1 Tax=Streptomyces erythrochromogenes TaxID=285574 RepID=UPI0036B3CB8B